MKKLLKNETGSVVSFVAAIIVILVTLISSVSLISLVEEDYLSTHYQQDAIQEELLLRTEAFRTHLSIEFNSERPLPTRLVEIVEPHKTTTFTVKNTARQEVISNFMGYATEQVVAVNSKISAKRARKYVNARKSPVKRETERYLRNESLAQYQYFTDVEASENADGGTEAAAVKFWGPDVFYGKVHSNDNIWIQQAGGGSNNGWPTFYDYVTTAKEFLKYPGGENLAESGAPMDQIFRGQPEPGWEEHVPEIQFSPDASEIQAHGIRPFDPEAEIVYVKLDGTSYQSMMGDIVLDEIKNFPVLSWYPHTAALANAVINADGNWFLDADTVWTNTIALYDTVWTNGPSFGVNNQSVWVESQLWIEGTAAGKQTWGSADTVFITDDILYQGTDAGDAPDDPDNANPSDYLGVVSEKSILIKYKHRDPFLDNTIRDGNCNDVYMYGAYAAIGKGDVAEHGIMSCHYDGIFTFEYQHPHGSTPNFTGLSPFTLQETTYTYIDFHKYIYPKNEYVAPNISGFNLHGNAMPDAFPCGFDYEDMGYINSYPNAAGGFGNYDYEVPYGTDWPWYNPVWPEERHDIVYERGAIRLYGAIAQRRRGFVHRSGSDDYNHPPGNQGEWDLSMYHYDGDHRSTGYDKDYHYDQRFLFVQPPDYPQIYTGWGDDTLTSFDAEAWFFIVPSDD